MSETGATAEQIEAATKLAWDTVNPKAAKLLGYQAEAWESLTQEQRDFQVFEMRRNAKYLVPSGYQIVPAGAVVLSAEEAETARDGLSAAAELLDQREYKAAMRGSKPQRVVWSIERYRALAAKLSGGAS